MYRDDRGTVLIVGIATLALAVALTLLAIDVLRLAVRRHEADLVADSGARAAVQALDLERYYRGEAARLPLDPAAARSRALAVVSRPWRVESVRVRVDAASVSVTGDVPLLLGALVGRPTVPVTGSAVAVLRRDP